MKYYLGIDTSNYTTSASIYGDGKIIKNIRIPLKVKDGERGLRQNEAVFNHVKNFPELMSQIGYFKLSAVGYSAYPRDTEGSYMPCFLAGASVATSIASLSDLPLYKFSHQAGHIAAGIYSSGNFGLFNQEFLAFHVSGGTTEILHVTDNKIEHIGGTLDLNAGQLIDRVGVKLGLTFPCGREMEELALRCDERININVKIKDFNCNLSGYENIADKMIAENYDKKYISKYIIESVKIIIDKLTENIINSFGALPVLYAGGVMSNSIIRNYITSKYNAYFAAPEYSADNAAGIAILCGRAEGNQ